MLSFVGGITLINIVLACMLSVIFHEMFHALAARIFGVALFCIRPTAIGIRARLRGNVRSFKKQVAIYLAGPFGNFLLAAVFIKGKGFEYSLFEANLAIGLFNLMPLYPLDGGQIFIVVFYKLVGSNHTFKMVKKLTIFMKIGLLCLGVVQILIFINPSLLIAAVMLPGTRLIEERVSLMKLENLLNRKQRIISKCIYPARHIVVMEDCTLSDIMQKLDYDRFHILYVLNRDMEILAQITEHQIIKAVQSFNATDRICDIFANQGDGSCGWFNEPTAGTVPLVDTTKKDKLPKI